MCSQRKDDHVNYASQQPRAEITNEFDDLRFVHHSLPQIACADIVLQTQFEDAIWQWPFFINAMTGGSHYTSEINRQLAEIAQATQLSIASGSQSAALKDAQYRMSFEILRKTYPQGFIFANLSANATLSQAEDAIAMLDANALQIHLNAPQELVMPEGDRDFTHWLENIATLSEGLSIPLVVKEVGFGMSAQTIAQLQKIGVTYIDVSGRGGTDFIAIEKNRSMANHFSYLRRWGQSCAASLLEAQPFRETLTFFASGGIRHPLDMVKSLALGARAVGLSGMILQHLQQKGVAATVALIQQWQSELKLLMAMLGAQNLEQLTQTDLLITGDLYDYAQARQIDVASFSRRTSRSAC